MQYNKKSKIIILMSLVLLIAVISGAVVLGASIGKTNQDVINDTPVPTSSNTSSDTSLEAQSSDINVPYDGPGEYPESYPKMAITSGGASIDWIRGDANFTGDPKVILGNTSFGSDAKYAKSVLHPISLKTGSLITFKADEVKGLEKPKYHVSISGKNDELKPYSSNGNSISLPDASGEYLFNLTVDWGKSVNAGYSSDNTTEYWFSVMVDNANTAGETDSNVYLNTQYGFSFSLPESWRGYTIVTDKWEGNDVKSVEIVETGPMISIRHSEWTSENQRQDIPIMILTLDQWNSLKQMEFHIGAAPILPSELGRNSRYIFALPARYNYAFPTGYEEVEKILAGNPLQPFGG